MGQLSPTVLIDPALVPALPGVLNKEALSAEGYVESVQATRLPGRAAAANLDGLAEALLEAYLANISRTAHRAVRPVFADDGSASFRLGGLTVLQLGPAERVSGEPARARRKVAGGLLCPRADRGRGYLQAAAAADGRDLLVEVRVSDYRSALRGTQPFSPLRQLFYRATQMCAHRRVSEAFLREVAPEVLGQHLSGPAAC